MSEAGITSPYWCYSCTRFVTAWAEQDGTGYATGVVSCPHCDGGFLEQIEAAPVSTRSEIHSRRSTNRQQRSGRFASFNPVVVLQGSVSREDEERDGGLEDGGSSRNRNRSGGAFEFYYDDRSGSGLRPLPDSVSEILMGSGFERLLEQLSQIQIGRPDNLAASKSAIEAMPRIQISENHNDEETHCAVCTEAFEVGGKEAREMPCKHVFHGDCILPWLSMRNTCPVCRFELPSDSIGGLGDEAPVGMTIWRLPGGGFAVGRFNAAARREGDRNLPVVLTEMDGGYGNSDVPSSLWWVRARGTAEATPATGNGRWGRAFRRFASLARRLRSNSSSSSTTTTSVSPIPLDLDTHGEARGLNRSRSLIGRYLRRGRSNRSSLLE